MKFLFLFFLTLPAYSFVPSQSKEDFCRDRQDKNFSKQLTQDNFNLLSFPNAGGLLNGGVCWWHSRFQRNALYLTWFDGQASKPSQQEAKTIIRNLRYQTGVVRIPGYANLFDFSKDFQKELQGELALWQWQESIHGGWRTGIRGKPIVSEEFLKKMMDGLYQEVEVKQNTAFQRLQIKGIAAHAWLVIHMTKREDGYDLETLDSVSPHGTLHYKYTFGDTFLLHQKNYSPFTPYLERSEEMENINKIIDRTCL